MSNDIDVGAIALCCGVPLLIVIIYSMAMTPSALIVEVFFVVLIGFIIIFFLAA